MAKMESAKADKKQDVALIKKAFKQHDAQEHKGGKGTALKLKKGGAAKYMSFTDTGKPDGMKPVTKMAKGGVTTDAMKAAGRNMARANNQKTG